MGRALAQRESSPGLGIFSPAATCGFALSPSSPTHLPKGWGSLGGHLVAAVSAAVRLFIYWFAHLGFLYTSTPFPGHMSWLNCPNLG